MINQREREAQQMLRAQRLADERAAFQRDAVLALQRAGLDYVNAYAKILAKAYEVYEETGRWPESSQLDEGTAYAGHEEAFFRLLSTRAQVFDDELRDLARAARKYPRHPLGSQRR